jgi:hypothetical protein
MDSPFFGDWFVGKEVFLGTNKPFSQEFEDSRDFCIGRLKIRTPPKIFCTDI